MLRCKHVTQPRGPDLCPNIFSRTGLSNRRKKLETNKSSFGCACIKLVDHCKLDTVPLPCCRGGFPTYRSARFIHGAPRRWVGTTANREMNNMFPYGNACRNITCKPLVVTHLRNVMRNNFSHVTRNPLRQQLPAFARSHARARMVSLREV